MKSGAGILTIGLLVIFLALMAPVAGAAVPPEQDPFYAYEGSTPLANSLARSAEAPGGACRAISVKSAAMTGEVLEVDEPSVLAGADSPTTPVEIVGWSQNNMVEAGGPRLTVRLGLRLCGERYSISVNASPSRCDKRKRTFKTQAEATKKTQ
jgi:hypothetical protein